MSEAHDDNVLPQNRMPSLCPSCERSFASLKLLPSCRHAYCSHCLRSRFTGDSDNKRQLDDCLLCQQKITILPSDIELLPTTEYFQAVLKADAQCEEWPPVSPETQLAECSVCPDGVVKRNVASWWCAECAQFLCERCIGVHLKGTTTRMHAVDVLSDVALRQTSSDQSALRDLDTLADCVAIATEELAKQTEISRQSDDLKREIVDEYDELRKLIDCSRDELTGELDDLIGTAERDVRRHLLTLKCFVQYCSKTQSPNVDRAIVSVLEQIGIERSGCFQKPASVRRSRLTDGLLAATFTKAGVRKYLPQHICNNVVGKLFIGDERNAIQENIQYKTWDEQFAEIQQQNEHIDTLQKQLNDCMRQLNNTNNLMMSKEEHINKMVQTMEVIQEKLQDRNKDIEKCNVLIRSQSADITRLSEDKMAMKIQIETLENQKTELTFVQKRQSEGIVTLKEELCQMKQANAKLFEEHDALKQSCDKLVESLDVKTKELAESNTANQTILDQVGKLRQSENELKVRLKENQESLLAIQREKAECEIRIGDMKTRMQDIVLHAKETENNLKNSVESCRTRSEVLEHEMSALNDDKDKMISEQLRLENEIELLKKEKHELINSEAKLRDCQNKLSEDLCLSSEENQKLSDERDVLEKSCKAAEVIVKQMEREIRQKTQNLERQVADLEAIQEFNKQLTETLQQTGEREKVALKLNEKLEGHILEMQALLQHEKLKSNEKEIESKTKLDAAADNYTDLEQQFNDVTEERNSLWDAKIQLQDEVQSLKDENRKLLNANQNVCAFKKKLEEQLYATKQANDGLVQELEDAKRQLSFTMKQSENHEKSARRSAEKLECRIRKVESLLQEHKDQTSRREIKLNCNLESMANKNVELQQKLVDLTNEKDRLFHEKTEKDAQIQFLENEKQELQDGNENLTSTRMKLEQELYFANQAKKQIVQERDNLEEIRINAEQEIATARQEIANQKMRETSYSVELEKLKEQLREMCLQLKQTQERESCYMKLNDESEERIEELQMQLENSIKESQESETEFRQSLDDANDANSELQSRVDGLTTELDQLRGEAFTIIKDAYKQSAEAREQIKSTAERDRVLRMELDKKRKREDELTAQLRKTAEREHSNDARVRQLESQMQVLVDERLGPNAVPIYELHSVVEVTGLTSYDHEFYIAKTNASKIEVYSSETFAMQRCINLDHLVDPVDLSSCSRYRCLYVADGLGAAVHRVDISRHQRRSEVDSTAWSLGDKPTGISVTTLECHVLVTHGGSGRLKQFTTNGLLVRLVSVEPELLQHGHLRHAVQLTTGQFLIVVAELGGGSDAAPCGAVDSSSRVCIVSSDGKRAAATYGGGHLLDGPVHAAVDRRYGYIYLADANRRRVLILSSDLLLVGELTDMPQCGQTSSPRRVWFDHDNRRLYVAQKSGRVVVYAVNYRNVRRMHSLPGYLSRSSSSSCSSGSNSLFSSLNIPR